MEHARSNAAAMAASSPGAEHYAPQQSWRWLRPFIPKRLQPALRGLRKRYQRMFMKLDEPYKSVFPYTQSHPVRGSGPRFFPAHPACEKYSGTSRGYSRAAHRPLASPPGAVMGRSASTARRRFPKKEKPAGRMHPRALLPSRSIS